MGQIIRGKNNAGEAQQVFRQFAWNLASSLKLAKAGRDKNTAHKPRAKRGKNK